MLSPISSGTILGRASASLTGSATSQRQENTSLQETTNKERAIKRFEDELQKLKNQGKDSDNKSVADSPTNLSQKLPGPSDQPGENEQYAKALLVSIREEIYKKGYKSSNKRRAAPSGKDNNQWRKEEEERLSKADDEVRRIRTPFSSGARGFLAVLKIIQNSIEAKGHNCTDLAHAGIGILDEAGIKDTHIVMFRDFDHGMILIGKTPPNGLPLDMKQWPSHLAICDPWANIACPAKEFIPAFMKKMQKWERNGKKIADKNVWVNPVHPDLEKKLGGRHKVLSPFCGKEHKDKYGRTPLMAAAYAGKVDDVQSLLRAGADLETKDNNGRTALMIATERGATAVVDLLFKAGANKKAKNKLRLPQEIDAAEISANPKRQKR